MLIVSEHGDDRRRGFWASWPQAGAPAGNLLATAVLALLAVVQSDQAFLAWGRRIPFLSHYVLPRSSSSTWVDVLKLGKSTALDAVLIGSAVELVAIPLWGALSDRLGRRPVYLAGALGMAGWIFAFFPMMNTGSTAAIIVATTVALVLHGAMYGPQAAFFSELFGTRVRYSGASIGYQLASILAGGLAPRAVPA